MNYGVKYMPYSQSWYENMRKQMSIADGEKFVCFDVGCADGEEFLGLAKKNKDIEIYGFEPYKKQYDIIHQKTQLLDNFHIYNVAVSNYSGTAVFNACDEVNFRTSSLKNYDIEADKNWANCYSGRFIGEKITDVWKVVDKPSVKVIKLDDFLNIHNVSHIHYLHCDTQGNDYEVIEPLIKNQKIFAGVIECSTFDDKPLYEDQKSLSCCTAFLESNGYKIDNTKEQANDKILSRGLETNLFFSMR